VTRARQRAAAARPCRCCSVLLLLCAQARVRFKPYVGAQEGFYRKAAQQNAEFSMTVLLRAERSSGGSGGSRTNRRCFTMTFRCSLRPTRTNCARTDVLRGDGQTSGGVAGGRVGFGSAGSAQAGWPQERPGASRGACAGRPHKSLWLGVLDINGMRCGSP